MSDVSKLLDEVNAAFGGDTISRGSDAKFETAVWPTGVLPFDFLLGGGLPAGRSVEVYGAFSTLKSYIALSAIATTQAAGGICALVDTEKAYDPEWAALIGVDTETLILQHPENGEEAVKVSEFLVRRGVDLLIWDSVAAAFPKAYQEAEPGSSKEAAPARLAAFMSKAMARLTTANSKTAMLFINQTRENVGNIFGPPETTPGGRALGYYASQRVKLSKGSKVTETMKAWDGEKWVDVREVKAYKIKANLEKSKLNRPHRELWFTYDLATTKVDEVGFLIAQGLEQGIITQPKKGTWEMNGNAIRGREKFYDGLTADPLQVEWLRSQVMSS